MNYSSLGQHSKVRGEMHGSLFSRKGTELRTVTSFHSVQKPLGIVPIGLGDSLPKGCEARVKMHSILDSTTRAELPIDTAFCWRS